MFTGICFTSLTHGFFVLMHIVVNITVLCVCVEPHLFPDLSSLSLSESQRVSVCLDLFEFNMFLMILFSFYFSRLLL